MGIAGAVIGGAALTAGASALSSSNQASAAQSAANTQAQAANQASADTLAEYQQTAANLAPYNAAGQATIGPLQSYVSQYGQPDQGSGLSNAGQLNALLTNLETPGNSASYISQLPGYQFILNQGQQGVANSNAAQGLGVSGAALKGAASYASGLADSTYSQQLQNIQNAVTSNLNQNSAQQGNVTNAYNRLIGVSGLGENAAATSGAQGLQATNQAGNFSTSGAAAQAAGTIGSANALTSGLTGVTSAATSAYPNYLLYNALSNGSLGSSGYIDQGSFS